MFPKFEKHAKHIIQDKERLDKVLTDHKETKSNVKTFTKAEKKYNKTIHKLEKDENISRDSIEVVIQEYLDFKKDVLLTEIDTYTKTKQNIKEEEWNLIIQESIKGFKKFKKFQDKQTEKNHDYWVKLEKKFKSNDEDIKNEITSMIDDYNKYKSKVMLLRSPSNKKLTGYYTTKDELIKMVDVAISAQRKLFDVRLDLRELIFNNPDKFKVNKAMNKLKKVTY
ncbi:hypothetical protein [Carboxylicivirga linearis]|uniref:Uncharacterized protein n=1 Tax=Carboxylicivirga linearis TaxID=1628157 RepID=A0ABS5JXF8_9BACT|nr:hypothetical protein [Carboxylicivirga linearis]MBS2099470.1 hypothetical protein [Carboxylicivirga linearis]